MDLWEEGKSDTLLQEAKRCNHQMAAGLKPMSRDQFESTFNRMMLQGRVRAAARLLTERSDCPGILDLESEAVGKSGSLGKTCFEVMREKHPPQKIPDPLAFTDCEELPPLEHVHITSSHVESIVRRLHGSAGPPVERI